MTPHDYLEAARVPLSIEPQEFGLWKIDRLPAPPPELCRALRLPDDWVGWPDYTVLAHETEATMHLPRGEVVVMEDSRRELRKHLPIWLAARGRVLITGLGLGCVLRGLLAAPHVEHVDVVEIDRRIIEIIGAEFVGNARVTIHHADVLKWKPPADARWDWAWHDLWVDGDHLQDQHSTLIKTFCDRVGEGRIGAQGAWAFPRVVGKRIGLLR